MNNKDLFNAINDIDEQFVADAGKYLSDDDSDDPSHSEAVEIFPGETRFSPIKLIAPLVAAAVLITGVTIALRYHRGRVAVAPNAAGTSGAAIAESDLDGDRTTSAAIDTHSLVSDGPLPFEIVGPDKKQLWYGDVTDFIGAQSIELLSEDNWNTITCDGFAYVASPLGCIFNNIDDAAEDLMILRDNQSLEHDFKRVYVGDSFGSLTVAEASNTFESRWLSAKDDDSNIKPEDYDLDKLHIAALTKNHVKFDGEITVDAYIVGHVDKNDNYILAFRNGETQIPLVNYIQKEAIKNSVYATELSNLSCGNGFQYVGELPTLTLGESERAIVEPYLVNANYLKATVTLSNIEMEGSGDYFSTNYEINCTMSKAVLNYVMPRVTDSNQFGETPFAGENEMKLRSILGSARTVEELQNNIDNIKQLTGCDNIKVFVNVTWEGDDFLDEITEGEITSGKYIALYNGDELAATYQYNEAVLKKDDLR